MDDGRASAAIIEAGRRLGARGLISAGEGNLSVRLDAERLLITPTGRRKDELEPDDLVIVRIGSRGIRGSIPHPGLGPSSDLRIHLAAHAARPDIGAVVHAHLPASMALTLAGEIPDPAALPETAFHLPRLPFVPFAEMGSAELAERIAARALGWARAACRAPSCSNATAPSRSDRMSSTAVDRLELVEVLCRASRDAHPASGRHALAGLTG